MEVGYLSALLAELGGHMRVWPDAAGAMRMMLSSAAARGEHFAAPCLALLEHAMAPLAPGSPLSLLAARIGELSARISTERAAEAKGAKEEPKVPSESKEAEGAKGEKGEREEPKEAEGAKEARRRVGELERELAAARRAQREAERERDVQNARYGKLLEESRALRLAAAEAESAREEAQKAKAELGRARARESAREAESARHKREAGELEELTDVMLAEQTRLRAALEEQTARAGAMREELEAAARFVAITERLARLVCAETVARAGGGSVELTQDSTAALRTAIDLHYHATVFEPAGLLNLLLRATCPIRAMRAWVGATERDGEKRRAAAAEAVASIRADCTSHEARQAMVRAMWEWADHAEVADVDGRRVRERHRSGLVRPDTVVASQEGARCPLSASTGEMLAALVAARLRSFDRWRRGG
jgi:hypothetical protein